MAKVTKNDRRRWFPLNKMEVMIVLFTTFLILLWFWFYFMPNYMTGCRKDREAGTNLGAIFNMQTQYRIEKGSYASGPNCFDLIGWKPEGQNLYNYVCGGQVVDSLKNDPSECFVPPVAPATRNGFTVYAIANLDNDATCDVWSMDDAKNLVRLVDDIKD